MPFKDWWDKDGRFYDLDWYQKRLDLAMKAYQAGYADGRGGRETGMVMPQEKAVMPVPAERPARLRQKGPGIAPRERR